MSDLHHPDPEAGLCLVEPAAALALFVHPARVNDRVTKDAASDLGWVATLSRSEGALVRNEVAVTWAGGPQISVVRLEPMVAP